MAGLTSVGIAMAIGVPLGLAAGFLGGLVDGFISRFTDAMLACPFLILAIALAAFLGPSLTNAMLAIGITATPFFIRLTRGQVLSIKGRTMSRRPVPWAIRAGASPRGISCRISCRSSWSRRR